MNSQQNAKFQENINLIILSAIIGLLFIAVFIYFLKRSKTARKGILILGLCDAGKTLIFSRILHNKFFNTYTSIEENISDYVTSKTSLKLIDIPGHEKIRGKFLDKYKKSIRGIIYVVDSSTCQKDIRDVAEYLFSILSDADIYKIAPRVLILCNKQDQATSKGSKVIMGLLEKEINVLRTTQSSKLESISDASLGHNIFLGKDGQDFEFKQLPFSVTFAEGAALTDNQEKFDLKDLSKWLTESA